MTAGWPPPAGRAVVRRLHGLCFFQISPEGQIDQCVEQVIYHRRMHRLLCVITHTQTHTTIIIV